LIGETVKDGAKCKDESLSKKQQRKNNHGCKKGKICGQNE